ncbi:hypothetical protein AVEN_13302-1 [Araneus ventricosus]|uniref:Uncharacterized protein n=1 Tax=Araneus ventricosus TaxID=182803 RepID=A0A4Y2V1U5_ARAVE|nr:hypothetical protein AVEN_13302-1 [Araneus ventricosus]
MYPAGNAFRSASLKLNGQNSRSRDTREMDSASLILKAIEHFALRSHLRAWRHAVKHWITFTRDISYITAGENVSNSFYAAVSSEEQVTFRTHYKSDPARFSHRSGYLRGEYRQFPS